MTVDWGGAGRLNAGGRSLEYQCWGPPPSEAPCLVLLHEGLGCVALWRDFPERLAAVTGCGVLAYSRAGYGASDPRDLPWPLDYMSIEATQVLPDVLNAIGLEQGLLVGHSDGATIAAIHAGLVKDDRVRGLVLMAPHFFTETLGLTEIEAARDAYDKGDLRARLGRYHAAPDNAFRGWNDSWLHPDFAAWDVSDVIRGIEVPVLAIQGQDDQYGTLAQIDVLSAQCHAPVDVLVPEACGHAPFHDQPEQILESMTTFCARVLGRGAPEVIRPPFAYVPGKTSRHPDGFFDAIRDTAQPGMSIDALSRCAAFRTGLAYLDSGFFWEAHEVLEPVWMVLPDATDEKRCVQALIQLANANLKQRMERPKAARRLCGIVQGLLAEIEAPVVMTLTCDELKGRVSSLDGRLKDEI